MLYGATPVQYMPPIYGDPSLTGWNSNTRKEEGGISVCVLLIVVRERLNIALVYAEAHTRNKTVPGT